MQSNLTVIEPNGFVCAR